mmetsp:Transcript_9028/g.23098  ORF Transcript_9028/g.23098 Transcript_9028/m.23098 type:complete len:204 (+) Transcript_9028:233-844(+)
MCCSCSSQSSSAWRFGWAYCAPIRRSSRILPPSSRLAAVMRAPLCPLASCRRPRHGRHQRWQTGSRRRGRPRQCRPRQCRLLLPLHRLCCPHMRLSGHRHRGHRRHVRQRSRRHRRHRRHLDPCIPPLMSVPLLSGLAHPSGLTGTPCLTSSELLQTTSIRSRSTRATPNGSAAAKPPAPTTARRMQSTRGCRASSLLQRHSR